MLAMMVCILASCSDGGSENPIEPTPKPEEVKTEIIIDSSIISNGLSFSAAEGEQSISFSVNANWTLSIASTTSGTTWCKASATSGSKGTANVKFTISENTDYEDRSVSVTIKAGTVSKTFTITQKGVDALLVTTTKYEVAQEGGQIEIEVKTNIDYKMEISEEAKDWIKESSGRALTTYKHKLDIAMNEDAEKREGEITFKSGDKVETVKVYQAGGAILLLSQNEYNVSDKGDTISVDIKSNIDFGVQMPDVDWIIDEASSRGMSSHTLKYIVAANEGYDNRSADVVFYDKNSDLKDTLKVVQAQKDAIIVAKNEYMIDAIGGDLKFEVNTNVDFEVTTSVDWIKQNDESRSLEAKLLSFAIAENIADESREGLITITFGELKQEIKIIQKAKSVFSLSETEFNIKSEGGEFKVEVSTNGEYTITMPEVDWLKENESRATSTNSHTFTVSTNETYDTRETEITFSHKETGEVAKVNVVQAQKDAIVISEKNISLTKEGGIVEIKVNSNVDFEVQIPSDVTWIVQTDSRALKESSVYLKVAENIREESRSVEIMFTNKESQICECVIINQAGIFKGSFINGIATVAIAGSLKDILGNDYLNIKSLKVIGNINGDDIKTIREMAGRDERENETLGKLTKLDISESSIISGGASYYSVGLNEYKTTDFEIGIGMFSKTNFIEISLPKNVKRIKSDAFNRSKNLCTIVLPDSLRSIGGGAFKNIENLEIIRIPEMVDSIGGEAFSGCKRLKSINIPESVKFIGQLAFEFCENLTNVYITNLVAWCNINFASGTGNWEHICYAHPLAAGNNGNLYLNNSLLTELEIPNEITTIKPFTFYNCRSIVSVKIPNHVVTIGRYAFKKCLGIDNLHIGSGVISIDKNSFYDCGGVEYFTIDNNLANIDHPIIPYHDKLVKLILSDKVCELKSSFYNAPLIEVCVYATTPPKINQYTFNRNKLSAKLYVPKGYLSTYKNSIWGQLFFKEIIEMDN